MAAIRSRKCSDGSISYYVRATINGRILCASFKTETEALGWAEQTEASRAMLMCGQCGKAFQSQPAKSLKYCSGECQSAANRISVLKYKTRIRTATKASRACQRCGAVLTGTSRRYCKETCTRVALHHGRDIPERSCVICGVQYKNAKDAVQTCGKACTAMKDARQSTRNCPTCGKDFIPTSTGVRGYCSDACRSVTMQCCRCSKQFERNLWFIRAKERPYCSHRCRLDDAKATRIEFTCEQCGQPGLRQPNQDYKRFCSVSCKRKFQGESSLERVVRHELERLGVRFEREVKIGRYSIDFLIEGRIALEADGDYWHTKLHHLRDEQKDIYLHANGFKVVRVSESMVKASVSCIHDLLSEHEVQEHVVVNSVENEPKRLTRSGSPSLTHGHTRGKKETPEHRAWTYLRRHAKCGIPVSDRWLESFEMFLVDVGSAEPERHVIGRKDILLPFGPDNYVWVTRHESLLQLRRMRSLQSPRSATIRDLAQNNKISMTSAYRWARRGITSRPPKKDTGLTKHTAKEKLRVIVNGVTLNIRDFCRLYGTTPNSFYSRVNKGMTHQEAADVIIKDGGAKGNRRKIKIAGVTKSITQWCTEYGVDRVALYNALKRAPGTIEERLTTTLGQFFGVDVQVE